MFISDQAGDPGETMNFRYLTACTAEAMRVGFDVDVLLELIFHW